GADGPSPSGAGTGTALDGAPGGRGDGADASTGAPDGDAVEGVSPDAEPTDDGVDPAVGCAALAAANASEKLLGAPPVAGVGGGPDAPGRLSGATGSRDGAASIAAGFTRAALGAMRRESAVSRGTSEQL
nr:hypothetical protein [Actinomycetota bacterium]